MRHPRGACGDQSFMSSFFTIALEISDPRHYRFLGVLCDMRRDVLGGGKEVLECFHGSPVELSSGSISFLVTLTVSLGLLDRALAFTTFISHSAAVEILPLCCWGNAMLRITV